MRTPTMHDVIQAVARPTSRLHVLQPDQPLQPNRAHPPLVPPGSHDYFELLICFSGEMSLVGFSATTRLQAGDAIVIKPGAWHYESYRRASQPYRACWFMTPPRAVNCAFVHYRKNKFLEAEVGNRPPLGETAALQQLAKEIDNQKLHWPEKSRARLIELLVDFDRRLHTTDSARPQQESDPVRQLQRIVQTRFRESLQIRTLAKEVGLSADHLSRRFHANCGTTFKDYLNTIRIHHARQLLQAGWSIKRTADECGFQDVYYFSRVFKEHCRTTPGQFMRQTNTGSAGNRV